MPPLVMVEVEAMARRGDEILQNKGKCGRSECEEDSGQYVYMSDETSFMKSSPYLACYVKLSVKTVECPTTKADLFKPKNKSSAS